MFSVSNDEMEKADPLGDTVFCQRCEKDHSISTSVGDKGECRIHFYKCRGTTYLAGMNGKSLMHRFKRK